MPKIGIVAALGALLSVAAVAAAAPPGSRQAAYDAAQAAYDKGDWVAAVAGFAPLLPQDHARALTPSEAVIASRLAFALLQQTRLGAARATAERAIAALPQSDGANLADALLTAGAAARFSYDYPEAMAAYRRAYAIAEKGGDRPNMIAARIGMAYAGATFDPVSTGKDLDSLLADKAILADTGKKDLATIEDLRGRAATNAGDAATAGTWLDRAIEHAGGLTLRVDTSQVAMRNDAAIAASLRKDDENTRKYLSYTGAGHLTNMQWIGRYDGELPVCSSFTDVRPDDSVVVEFAIADDGHVGGALPIYASRPGPLGALFARTVSDWHWDPNLLKGVDPFWRSTLVLQLRCQSRPKPDGLDTPVKAALAGWLRERNVDDSTEDLDRYVADGDPRLQEDDVSAIPVLLKRITQDHQAKPEQAARLRHMLDEHAAPPSAYALVIAADAANRSWSAGGVHQAAHVRAATLGALVPPFQARYPGDLSTAWLVLEWALALEDAGDFRAAQPLLHTALATPTSVLAEDAPIRRVAQLHAALAAQKLGDASTDAALARSGLSADQCSLFDTHPIPSSVSIASSQFPSEALRWHFEGYVREAFDIGDDGRVTNIRTIVAYPPFVFAAGTEQAVRSFRYVPPTIAGRSVGCTGEEQTVNYRIPTR